MKKPLENNDILAILPFDHRTGLYREFGWTEPLSDDQKNQMRQGRRLIYDAIIKAVADGIPQDQTIVFTDDLFGAEILRDARAAGFTTSLTMEQSGLPYFDFEHADFASAIESIQPDMVKALVRYNPAGDASTNAQSRQNLKRLSDHAREHGLLFLIEPLIAGTESQLETVARDNHRFDHEIRPTLTVQMIHELQNAGIEPDVWKIEGFSDPESYRMAVAAAQQDGRTAHIIALGRNESDEVVGSWLQAGAPVPGVIGFAVGRTVFLEPLKQFMAGTISRESAVSAIAEKFKSFYDVFIAAKISNP